MTLIILEAEAGVPADASAARAALAEGEDRVGGDCKGGGPDR